MELAFAPEPANRIRHFGVSMLTTTARQAGRLLRRTMISGLNVVRANNFAPSFYDDLLRSAFPGGRPVESDISDHLPTIFADIVSTRPRLVVELGTRGGESTKAILAASSYSGAVVLSVDIEDCTGVALPNELRARWDFVRSDDVAFARDGFPQWCAAKGIDPVIDVLFIDTSHLYHHTVRELAEWERFVPPGGIVLFHDTNLRKFGRTVGNRVLNIGWENERGVIRAIEEFLGQRYDESTFFVDVRNGWLVRHHPNDFGLTLLRRMPTPQDAS